jgi:ArsR family transcriptional regulator
VAKALPLPDPVRERGVCCPAKTLLRAEKADLVATILKALSDPTRLQMALILRDADGPLCICDLTATFDLSQPTVSHHMAKLRAAGLVESSKQGIWSHYRIARDLPSTAKRILATL